MGIGFLFLGTGNAMTTEKYNTCFLVRQEDTMLVDCGGGHEILKQLKNNNIFINDIDAIFITHSNIDHILGFPFLFRLMIIHQKEMKVICSRKVKQEIESLLFMDIPEHLEQNKNLLRFHIIEDNPQYKNFSFFPVDKRQYGFLLSGEKRIAFMGDVTCNEKNVQKIEGCDVLIHEAYCSVEDNVEFMRDHSTIEDVIKIANKAGAKQLIITHTKTNLTRFNSENVRVVVGGDTFTI